MRRSYRGGRRRLGQKINSFKSVINNNLTLVALTDNEQTLLTGVDSFTGPGSVGNVPTGAHVYSMDVTISAVNPATSVGGFHLYMAKSRSGQAPASDFPSPDAVGHDPIRNQIWNQFQTGIGPLDGKAVQMSKRIKIPKVYQRVREGDKIFLKFKSSVATTVFIQVIYKFYR